MTEQTNYLYRVVLADQWKEAQNDGLIPLSPLDKKTGVVHLSKRIQVIPTLITHFSPDIDTIVLAVDHDRIQEHLKWNAVAARDGEIFPHLYRRLTLDDVVERYQVIWNTSGPTVDFNTSI